MRDALKPARGAGFRAAGCPRLCVVTETGEWAQLRPQAKGLVMHASAQRRKLSKRLSENAQRHVAGAK